MRITGGQFNGRVLGSLSGMNIRPTSSKVRQAVFNIIGNDTSGFHVMDIFAGTGIMGIEALSRGADWAMFFDNSGRSLELIRKNLELCGLDDRGYVIKGEIKNNIPSHERLERGAIDLAFIDPPYGKDLISGVLIAIVKNEIMADNGLIVTESKREDKLPGEVGDFILNKTRIYGETKIDIYERRINESESGDLPWNI
jgi:16S rRNA (guanine966-N2)-methyltransferase